MKAKLLLMLFLVSLSLGVLLRSITKRSLMQFAKFMRRWLLEFLLFFSIQAEDINDCLYLTSQFSLNDADITMLDKDGNEKV